MASKSTVAESIKRLAILYKDMVEAADAIEQIGSIEQAVSEAKAARMAAEAERDSVIADLKKAKDGVKKAKDDADRTIADGKEVATEIIAAANAAAQSITDSATEQGQALIDSAKEQREETLKDLDGEAAVWRDRILQLQDETAHAVSVRDAAEAAAKDAQAKLDKVQASIRKLAEV